MLLKLVLLPWYFRMGANPTMIRLTGFITGTCSFLLVSKENPVILSEKLRYFRLDRVIFFFVNLHNYFLPHAPDVMYEIETKFYRLIRPKLTINCPKVFGTIFDSDNCRYGVLMEDLATISATFPKATTNHEISRVKSALLTLAELHANFWNKTDDEMLQWLPTPTSGGMEFVFHGVGFGLIRDHVETHPYQQVIHAKLMFVNVRVSWL